MNLALLFLALLALLDPKARCLRTVPLKPSSGPCVTDGKLRWDLPPPELAGFWYDSGAWLAVSPQDPWLRDTLHEDSPYLPNPHSGEPMCKLAYCFPAWHIYHKKHRIPDNYECCRSKMSGTYYCRFWDFNSTGRDYSIGFHRNKYFLRWDRFTPRLMDNPSNLLAGNGFFGLRPESNPGSLSVLPETRKKQKAVCKYAVGVPIEPPWLKPRAVLYPNLKKTTFGRISLPQRVMLSYVRGAQRPLIRQCGWSWTDAGFRPWPQDGPECCATNKGKLWCRQYAEVDYSRGPLGDSLLREEYRWTMWDLLSYTNFFMYGVGDELVYRDRWKPKPLVRPLPLAEVDAGIEGWLEAQARDDDHAMTDAVFSESDFDKVALWANRARAAPPGTKQSEPHPVLCGRPKSPQPWGPPPGRPGTESPPWPPGPPTVDPFGSPLGSPPDSHPGPPRIVHWRRPPTASLRSINVTNDLAGA